VPKAEFLPAIALNSAQFNLGRIAGPALAGAAVAAFGYPVAFVANAVSFLAVVAALALVRLAPPAGRGGPGLLRSLRDGLAAARGERSSWAAIWTIAVVAVIASPFIALVPAMALRLSINGHTINGHSVVGHSINGHSVVGHAAAGQGAAARLVASAAKPAFFTGWVFPQ